jgi:hypothetical protein
MKTEFYADRKAELARVKQQQAEPFARAIQNVGNEDVRAAIVHLRGKAVRVIGHWRKAWTHEDVQAVETLIWFCLTLAKDMQRGGGM